MGNWKMLAILVALWMVLVATSILFILNWNSILVDEKEYTSRLESINLEEENRHSDYVWNNVPLKYKYDASCSFREDRIIKAFKEISRLTENKVNFVKVNDGEDIEIICDISPNFDEKEKDYLGKAKIRYLSNKKEILSAKIYLYGQVNSKCTYPDVEVHEIIHALGQGHSNIKGSVMAPMQISCLSYIDLEVDEGIFNNIKGLY